MKSTDSPKAGQLQRTTFRTSRLLDFCSEKELTAQTGHERDDWPLVALKELLDNALDACESAGVAPKISIVVDATGITIADNGPGIPVSTIDGILDYSVRVSSCEAYVSPTRGAQGNALKTILAMPFVLDGNAGRVDISARGQRHEIMFAVDRVRQQPAISRTVHEELVQNGTKIKVHWPVSPSSQNGREAQNVQDLYISEGRDPDSASEILTGAERRFVQLAHDYTFLNPHLTLTVDWFGKQTTIEATAPKWLKWLPTDPTPAHWYGAEEFQRLIAAYIADDQDHGKDRSIRELVEEFRGLARTAKQKAILTETALSRVNLSALASGDGLDHNTIAKLLDAMKRHSKPIKPIALGAIGETHIKTRFEAFGCEMESFEYKRVAQVGDDGLPTIVESAFAWCSGSYDYEPRRMITGINWSPGIVNPFRSLGSEYGDGLAALLENRHAGRGERIIFLLHCVCPRVRYTDRGKSAVVVENAMDSAAILKCVDSVTKKWTKQRKAEERGRARSRREALTSSDRGPSIKHVAWQVLKDAYLKASGGGKLPASARQIYYAARTPILQATGKRALDSQYFTQAILPAYVAFHREQTARWDITYDARGHFAEPHTKVITPLGTLDVRHYLAKVKDHVVEPLKAADFIAEEIRRFPTCGPKDRFSAVLFIEKEGFMPLFAATKLAERYDLAIMSTKGMPVVACRHLADELCGGYGIPLLVLHDFDKAGFSIYGTLAGLEHVDADFNERTLRYEYRHSFDVIDLGLRLKDVRAYNLESEPVSYRSDPSDNLEQNGTTAKEIKFLYAGRDFDSRNRYVHQGRRVELNAFTSADFIRWIEAKLAENGIKKVEPDADTLEAGYRRALQIEIVRNKLESIVQEAGKEAQRAKIPGNLKGIVQKGIKADPALSWDRVVADQAAAATCTKREPRKAIEQAKSPPPKPSKCTKPKRGGRAA